MIKLFLLPLGLLLFLQVGAQAAFTDFSDFTQNESFSSGEIFQSHGLSFQAVDLLPTLTDVRIFAGIDFAILAVGPGVDFQLPAGIQEISFPYDDGAGIGIEVNGVQPVYPGHAGFSFLDSTSLAGVSISITVESQTFGMIGSQKILAGEEGLLILIGPITSFTVAGLELSIDDVLVRVPEPSAATLLMVASVMAMSLRRRRRC